MFEKAVERAPMIVWIAGTGWDSVPGTDKRLVGELASDHQLIWVDPPVRFPLGRPRDLISVQGGSMGDNIIRVPVHTLPGITKPVVRQLTTLRLNRAVRRAVAEAGTEPTAVVVSFPIAEFPPGLPGTKILYVTDDWLGGSSLMGFSGSHVKRVLAANIESADIVAAVTPGLLEQLGELGSVRHGVVLPNGCLPLGPSPAGTVRGREIGLVGQLNERLDMDLLEAMCRTGEQILVVGPRRDRGSGFGKRLDSFLAAKNVDWVGSVPASELPKYFARMKVGVTPYVDSPFNRASFPLKTLEYLSAGVPVVATDLPAVRWLDSDHVQAAANTEDFLAKIAVRLDGRWTRSAELRRRQFAGEHSWAHRAADFSSIIGTGTRSARAPDPVGRDYPQQ